MSRIGRKPVVIPKGVTLTQKAGQFSVKGPKGELAKQIPDGVTMKLEGDKVTIFFEVKGLCDVTIVLGLILLIGARIALAFKKPA